MGCLASHFENDADYFLDKIYSTFPLSKYTFEKLEDFFEKNISDFSNADQFSFLFKKKFNKDFDKSEMKNYQYLIIDYLISKLKPSAQNYDYFKYNFLLFSFPFINHNSIREELVNNFKEIFIYLCDFKKSQIDIVKQMQNILYNYFYFVLFEIPEVIVNYITEVKNDDMKYLNNLINKLNFFYRKKIDDEVNRIINNFFTNMKKKNLSDSLSSCFGNMHMHYFEIQRFFN